MFLRAFWYPNFQKSVLATEVLENTYISQRDKERQHMHEKHCKEKNLEILIEYKTKDTAF